LPFRVRRLRLILVDGRAVLDDAVGEPLARRHLAGELFAGVGDEQLAALQVRGVAALKSRRPISARPSE
jgi:hypothetical protein